MYLTFDGQQWNTSSHSGTQVHFFLANYFAPPLSRSHSLLPKSFFRCRSHFLPEPPSVDPPSRSPPSYSLSVFLSLPSDYVSLFLSHLPPMSFFHCSVITVSLNLHQRRSVLWISACVCLSRSCSCAPSLAGSHSLVLSVALSLPLPPVNQRPVGMPACCLSSQPMNKLSMRTRAAHCIENTGNPLVLESNVCVFIRDFAGVCTSGPSWALGCFLDWITRMRTHAHTHTHTVKLYIRSIGVILCRLCEGHPEECHPGTNRTHLEHTHIDTNAHSCTYIYIHNTSLNTHQDIQFI